MEHKNSASSKENGGLFTGLLQMYGRGAQLASNDCFPGTSSGNCPPQNQAVCHKTESKNAYACDLATYLENFPSDDFLNQEFSFESSSRIGCQHEAPARMPPETLLDAISVAQRRLQHLEVIVRMMIQGRGHPQGVQQNQTLSMAFTSIMSQLSAATSVFSSPPPFHTSSPIAPQPNDSFDFGFDGFNDEDFNNTFGEGSICPPTGGMDVMLPGGPGIRACSQPAWAMDVRAVPVEPTTTTSEEGTNMFTSVNAQETRGESIMEKGTSADSLDIIKAHHSLESEKRTPICTEEPKEEDDDGEGESLPPGSYDLVELAATEILAEHTHFCEICGKGFKRDANLRMHMRGHGDEYKTVAALARPDKSLRDSLAMKPRRYSCPYAGCKRNKNNPKFQPLKTMLCVKNHYRRSHCPKVLVCSRCKSKKFSVIADLKTHEKHCGQDKWQCSCGTTFSRKDKLFGHIGLFAGHTPAALAHETERSGNIESGLEGPTSSGTDAPGLTAIMTHESVDRAHGVDVYKMPMMVTRNHEGDKG